MTTIAPETVEQTTLDPTNPADITHIVDQRDAANDVTSAVIEGREVTALCGYRFIPYRQPEGRPVCQPCVDAYGKIVGA